MIKPTNYKNNIIIERYCFYLFECNFKYYTCLFQYIFTPDLVKTEEVTKNKIFIQYNISISYNIIIFDSCEIKIKKK